MIDDPILLGTCQKRLRGEEDDEEEEVSTPKGLRLSKSPISASVKSVVEHFEQELNKKQES